VHPSAERVAQALRGHGAAGPFLEFDVPTKTAADAAAALGCDVGAIASSLVFVADDAPVVVVKSGAFRVDVARLGEALGATSVRMASPEEVRAATGQAIGGVSPVNWPGPLRVVIEETLADFERVWAACGTPNAVFATTYPELIRLTGASPVSLMSR
jgi:prolyl-tRNA editing enzyme YbaK/EbsC (Cys-tRNA(Pro) deacylase)